MNNKITVKELNGLKSLLETQDNLIYHLEEYSKQLRETQLRTEFQKLCASAKNHKKKLLSVLDGKSE
ncbi:MAG: hypothetical protein ACI4I7_04720 [Oscillospiraceae bacterium]